MTTECAEISPERGFRQGKEVVNHGVAVGIARQALFLFAFSVGVT
jgi:hypothetical protein